MKAIVHYNGMGLNCVYAVVYARYSSHNQGEQSIEGQLAQARAYAKVKGYTIIHEYVDRAMTGKNDNRDEFQQMLADCAKKKFQVIIVWKVDRFGRNREEITFNKYRAKKHGVRVEYVAENVGDGPESVILESVLEGMAEYYSLQLSQNIRRGVSESAKKCKYTGGRIPLGYKLDDEKHFVINPETAPIVRNIFDMYSKGKTITEIINEMNAQGLRTSQKEPFTKNSLRTILKNEKYIGVYDFKNGEFRKEDGVPAIIDKDTFYRVQELLKINNRAPAHKWSRVEYLLTEKLFCGHCGAAMIGESGFSKQHTKYSYYKCVNHKRLKTCTKKAVRQDEIERLVLEKTKEIITDDATLEYIAENTWQHYLSQDDTEHKVESLKKQLNDNDNAITNLMRAIEAGLPLTERTKNRIEELNEQHEQLTTALAGIELSFDFRLTKNHILFFLKQFQKMDFSNIDCQRRIIQVFINSIFVYDDEMTINYNFGGKSETVKFDEMAKIRAETDFDCRALSSATTQSNTVSTT